MKQYILLFFLVCFVLMGGCASIPKQAPMLSEDLGLKINSIQASHLSLLNSFFENEKEKVDAFIVEEWIPVFERNFFNDPIIQTAWEEIVKSGNKEDRLRLFVMIGPRLQAQINQKRIELIKPLDDLENELESKIRSEYDVARSINNSITSFLYSASKVEENRTRYLEMIGIKDEAIGEAIIKTDEIVNKLVTVGESLEEKEEIVESYIENLKNIRVKISSNLKNQ